MLIAGFKKVLTSITEKSELTQLILENSRYNIGWSFKNFKLLQRETVYSTVMDRNFVHTISYFNLS